MDYIVYHYSGGKLAEELGLEYEEQLPKGRDHLVVKDICSVYQPRPDCLTFANNANIR